MTPNWSFVFHHGQVTTISHNRRHLASALIVAAWRVGSGVAGTLALLDGADIQRDLDRIAHNNAATVEPLIPGNAERFAA